MSTLEIKRRNSSSFNNNLIISDLDTFFIDVYDYYYNRGYNCMLTQTTLDNISYLFSIHFTILNFYAINWPTIIHLCVADNICSSDITQHISFDFIFTGSFLILYGMLMIYYLIFLVKSVLYLFRMKKIKHIFDTKLLIKQKDLVEKHFDDVITRLIELQATENFCRVKETLTKYDIISRVMRRDNYLIAILSNNVLDFTLHLPYVGKRNFFTSFLYNNLLESVMGQAFSNDNSEVSAQFYNVTLLQMRMIMHLFLQVFCIPAMIILKIIFWVFKNADNIKSNRNITSKIWSSYSQVVFRNYNELLHHYENRINISYLHTERFLNCFKEKRMGLIRKFLVLISGSFLCLVFLVSSIDNRLLTELKLFGRNFVFVTLVIGVVLKFAVPSENKANLEEIEENYIENVSTKDKYFKLLSNCLENTPDDWKYVQNMSYAYKKICRHYEYSFWSMMKELISILVFPVVWIKIIAQVRNIIRFIKLNSTKIEGIGTVCLYSVMDMNTFRLLREKENLMKSSNLGKKYLNSYFYFDKHFNKNNSSLPIIQELYKHYLKEDYVNEDEFMSNTHYYISQVSKIINISAEFK